MKIGILTYYYKSSNYGGLLQAYALTKFLNDRGFDAEQICFERKGEFVQQETNLQHYSKRMKELSIIGLVKNKTRARTKRVLAPLIKGKVNLRRKSCISFRNLVPHSSTVYTVTDIKKTNNCYDCFIAGSDRIWNLNIKSSPYFLGFVQDKLKFSYAASMTKNSMNDEDCEFMRSSLQSFAGISVREEKMVELLSPITNLPVTWVVDPTFLLTETDWDLVVEEIPMQEDYVFCYFLGGSKENRTAAKKYAHAKKLKIVNIQYANDEFVFSDVFFGDYKLSDVSPGKFISLIKHAKVVFTDSFHATVFSTIYHKEVFSFDRTERKNSGTRIESLTGMLGTQNHFCDSGTKKKISYLINAEQIDYSKVYAALLKKIEESKDFLSRTLKPENEEYNS